MSVLLLILFFLCIDFYAFQAIKAALQKTNTGLKYLIFGVYWLVFFIIISIIIYAQIKSPIEWNLNSRFFSISLILCSLIFKLILIFFLFFEDLKRLFIKIKNRFTTNDSTQRKHQEFTENKHMSRSAFLSKTAIGIASLPVVAILHGIARNAYRYQKHFIDLKINNLPKAFENLKIVQISDIHSGSFTRPDLVARGIDMINEEKPDLIFFTGDLVNFKSEEFIPYIDLFSKISAKNGVYSILGNHDYGDYIRWKSINEKKNNLNELIQHHKKMGWNILIDEHVKLEKDNASMAIIGVGNWGKKFAKYGKLEKAYNGCQNCDVKLLLSHDPSHWEAEIIPKFGNIDVTFSGHTHGFQFGIEIPGIIKWSPVQWVYKQWAGLYEIGKQQLYVNRGFGFHALPGRVGILPEITVFTLKKA